MKKTDNWLSWSITFYNDAPTSVTGQVEKGVKKKTSHEIFLKENFSRCFQLEIGDVIAKKLSAGGLICHLTDGR